MKNGRLLDDSFKFARLDSIKLILRIPLKCLFLFQVELNEDHQSLMKSIIKSVENLSNVENIKMESDFHISISKVFQIKLKTYDPLCQGLDDKFKSIIKLLKLFCNLVVNEYII
jgi:hypothetical protein